MLTTWRHLDDSHGLWYRFRGQITVGLDSSDFGLGGLTAGLDSPALGTWTRTGPGSSATKYLYFSYDAAGNHTYTVVVHLESTFPTNVPQVGIPGDFSYTADVFLAAQNPATDTAVIVGAGSGAGQTWLVSGP